MWRGVSSWVCHNDAGLPKTERLRARASSRFPHHAGWPGDLRHPRQAPLQSWHSGVPLAGYQDAEPSGGHLLPLRTQSRLPWPSHRERSYVRARVRARGWKTRRPDRTPRPAYWRDGLVEWSGASALQRMEGIAEDPLQPDARTIRST